MAISHELGTEHEVEMRRGRVRYRDTGGDGPVAVLVHGVVTNADLWRDVVPGLQAAGLRCISPDWPLGGHQLAMPGADLTAPGVAALIAEFLERLDLRDVTLIGNDTGGGLVQMCMAWHAERIGRVVLTPSDSFEAFPPRRFAYLGWLPRIPGALRLVALVGPWPINRWLPIGLGGLAKHRVPADITRSWYGPARRDPAVRDDLRRFLRGMRRRDSLAAADQLTAFDKPVLLVWPHRDRAFPVSLAHRLVARLPQARLVDVDDSYTYVPTDQPERLVRETLTFLDAHRGIGSSPSQAEARPSGERRAR